MSPKIDSGGVWRAKVPEPRILMTVYALLMVFDASEGHLEGPKGVQVAPGGQLEGPKGVQVAAGGQLEGPEGLQVAAGGQLEGPSEGRKEPKVHLEPLEPIRFVRVGLTTGGMIYIYIYIYMSYLLL